MAISGWFVALVALGIVPIVITGAPIVFVYWVFFVVLLGTLDLILAVSVRALRFERTSPDRVRLGETTSSALRVTNPTRRRLRAIVRDGWQPSAGAHANRVPLSVPAGERRELTTVLTPLRRGTREAAHVTLRSYGPLRLIARQTTVSVPSSFTVLPPFNSRKHLPSRLARLRELDGATSVMIRGQGTEFDSLRDYVRGDDVRSIDWRATARRSELVVRTWRPERDRRVVIVVDSGRTSAARIEDEPRIDTAFESALLLAALASSAGDHVDFMIYDRRVRARVQGATGPDLLSKMVNSMAPVQPELIEMDWNAVPNLVRQATTQRALVVIATTAESPGATHGLLAMLPQLTAKHTVVVASVTDPSIVDATLDRSSRDAVYLAGAAERALLDQSRVANAINQLGASVVSRRPADLPLALADHYIALKAAGKL
ncbi:uncharacterized protein (DUF58 family) [Salinibacterium amurskyense]|uniref:Uncharacterized protein (DUF58 family) n=1 Tax=Salinibacterium amurskyense TaxID=205941 RepID=A0A2M9D7Z3_9MICO|nr:DUF58 domain-containing protein [Salinibacterium amurskyense]PJJ81824.1 uncharacterized protein (DUF58 family) [Salinibacterium amurskyense]RLQ81624.1 DUF58 domain-containing protein [Salinibacterium amurskyense]GHD79172.1 lipoprotein [Salinibacterium amurskyense]